MSKSQETYNKKEVRNKKEKKRKEKALKKLERRANTRDGNNLDDMIAYVDENGMITSEPPDPDSKRKVKAEDIEISVPRVHTEKTDNNIRHGILVNYNQSKGYGFIRDLANQNSVFVHVNDMEGRLSENSKVTFETEKGPRGLKAIHVRLFEQ
jgi:cold shock CspA family protein